MNKNYDFTKLGNVHGYAKSY